MTNKRCLNCQKFSFQRAPAHWQRSGKGPCERHEAFTLFDPLAKRECDYFADAGKDVVARRERWLVECNAKG